MTTTLPLISVIMPCYNAEKYVTEAIDSVITQTYPNIELIIVDDGSNDNSYEICQQLAANNSPKIQLFQQQNNGPYPARNNGLQHASGSYIAFLDADDYWENDCLNQFMQAIHKHNADIAYCGWQNVGQGGPGSNEPYIPPVYEQGDIIKSFLKSCPWPIHAALTKKSIIEELGGFSERYFTSLDFDLWLRSSSVTTKIVQVPKVLAYYRWHSEGQISSIKSRQVIDAWKVKTDYIKKHSDLVAHINSKDLDELVKAPILSNAYIAYWRRDFDSARTLFKKAFFIAYWQPKDIKYMLLSLLSTKMLRYLLKTAHKN